MNTHPEDGQNQIIEASALSVKNNLRVFARGTLEAREKSLAELIIVIKQNARLETLELLTDRTFHPKLMEAVRKTLETPFEVEGEPVLPWAGGFTIVALDQKGDIRGAFSKPTEGLGEYGDLHPYALTKAVLAFHLDSIPRDDTNLENLEYFKYAERLAKTKIYNGASKRPANVGTDSVFIGGSGCAVKKEYLKELLGGAKPSHDTQAGRFDAVFCDLVGFYLTREEALVIQRPEPKSIQEIRINN